MAMVRSRARRHGARLLLASLLTAATAMGAVLVQADAATVGTPRPLPPPSKKLVDVLNEVAAQDRSPGMSPERAVRSGSLADADAASAAVDLGGCVRGKVIASTAGTGATRTVTIVGSSVTFRINAVPTTWWKTPPVSSAVWALYFRGLYWAGELVPQLVQSGDAAGLSALVATAAQSVAVNPDPGVAKYGWDEGTNLRREQALNCLWRASGGDPRLVPAIRATVKANMDMSRYYGLPNFLPHNHGLMANLALIDTGDLFNRDDWREYAASRLARDSSALWTPAGFSIEQSAAYLLTNKLMWEDVADLLATYSNPDISGKAPSIRAGCARAATALAHLTTPQSELVPYGDGIPRAVTLVPQRSGAVRDDTAGVITGRWSWSDPRTSYYMFRYGGPRRMHGHEDRQGMVWSTLGVPVLIDVGSFSYDPGIYTTFAKGPVGHSTQLVRNRSFVPSAWVKVTGRSSSGPIHGVSTSDAQYGLTHARSWRIDNGRRTVTVTDRVAAAATTTLHLARGWTLRSRSSDGRTLVFTTASGRRCVVRGSHPMTVRSGSTRPVLGWVFPALNTRYWAPQILMSPPAGTSWISLSVS